MIEALFGFFLRPFECRVVPKSLQNLSGKVVFLMELKQIGGQKGDFGVIGKCACLVHEAAELRN